MLKHSNARLVFIRHISLLAALCFVILSCAVSSAAQSAGDNYGVPVSGDTPISQAPVQGYAAQASDTSALPDDWPQALSVPGMEKVTGLVRGDNNVSYAIKILSKDSDKVNFQVSAFCVYNPESDYAILHILDKPLMGVIDPDKKALQIDFSPLDSALESVQTIDKANVNKVLMQEPDSLVLNTVMSVQSMDGSQVKFSITDMSLLQPDGTLDEFSLPGPVPAIYDTGSDRFSTVAFNELTNVLQQNFIQQNTYVNVVNEVNVVNMINVADFGGFGCGGLPCGGSPWGGLPYGGLPYGGYGGGYGGYGGLPYGGYGGAPYSGFAPYSDPLPLSDPSPISPVSVPDSVQVYNKVPMGAQVSDVGTGIPGGDTVSPVSSKAVVAPKAPCTGKAVASKAKPIADTAAKAAAVPAVKSGTGSNLKTAKAPATVKMPASGSSTVKQAAAKPVAQPAAMVKAPSTAQQAVKPPSAKQAAVKVPADAQAKAQKTPVAKTAQGSNPQALSKPATMAMAAPQPKQTSAQQAKAAYKPAPVQAKPQAAYKPATAAKPVAPQVRSAPVPARTQAAYKPAPQAVKSASRPAVQQYKPATAAKPVAPQVRSAPVPARTQAAVHAPPISRGNVQKVAAGGGKHR